jgi:hypothetical protein
MSTGSALSCATMRFEHMRADKNERCQAASSQTQAIFVAVDGAQQAANAASRWQPNFAVAHQWLCR